MNPLSTTLDRDFRSDARWALSDRFSRNPLLIAITLWVMAWGTPLAAAEPGPPAHDLSRVQRLYVPAATLGKLLSHDKFGAVLPLSEFEELLKQAQEAATSTKPKTPLLTNAVVQVRVEGEQLVADVRADGASFTSASVLQLQAEGWNVESAKLNGEPAPIARSADNLHQLRLFLREPAEFQLLLQLSAPLRHLQGGLVAAVTPIGAPAELWEITLPEGRSLSVNGTPLSGTAEAGAPATFNVPVGGMMKVELGIHRQGTESHGDPLRFAESAFGLRIQPGEATWSVQTNLQIYGSPLDSLSCSFPKSVELIKVSAPQLREWSVEESEDLKTLNLRFHTPLIGTQQLSIEGVVPEGADQIWTFPALRFADMTAQTGRGVIQYPSALRLRTLELSGATLMTPFGPPETGFSQVGYDIWRDDFVIRFTTTVKEQQLRGALTNLLRVTRQGVDLTSTATFQPRRVPQFEARLRFPAEYRVVAAWVGGKSTSWTSGSDIAGVEEIRIPFDPPLAAGESRTVMLVMHLDPEGWPVEDAPVRLMLPDVRLPQASTVEGLYGIAGDPQLTLSPIDLTGLDPAPEQELSLLTSQIPATDPKLSLAFAFGDSNIGGQLEVSRHPYLLTVDTTTFFRVDRESTFTHFEAALNVTGGGITALTVRTPESLGSGWRFQLSSPQGAQLIEQIPGEVSDGGRNWQLRFDRELQGTNLLTMETQAPREASAVEFTPPNIVFPQAAAQAGFVAVEGAPDDHVRITATRSDGELLAVVDPVDFPSAAYTPQQRIVAAFRTIQQDWRIAIASHQFARTPIPTVIGQQAELVSILGDGGEFQHQLTLTFNASGAQSLLLRLPENAQLWSATIDETPVEARQTAEGVRVTLTGLASQADHRLVLVYASSVAELEQRGVLQTTVPQLAVIAGNGLEQPLEILRRNWELHYPSHVMLTSSEGPIQPQPALRPRLGLSLPHLTTDILTRESLPFRLNFLVGTIVASVMIALVARKLTQMQARSALLMSFIFIVTLVGLFSLIRLATRVPKARMQGFDRTMALQERQAGEAAHAAKPVSPPADATIKQLEESSGESRRRNFRVVPESPSQPTTPATAAPPVPDGGARLSLAVGLEVPSGMRLQRFALESQNAGQTPQALELSYFNRSTGRMLLMAVALGTTLLGWWLRNFPRPLRLGWFFATVLVPLAVCPVLPVLGQVIAQGVLIGGLLSLLGWGLSYCEFHCRTYSRWLWGHIFVWFAMAGILAVTAGNAQAAEPETAPTQPFVVIPYESFENLSAAQRVLIPQDLFTQLWSTVHPEDLLRQVPSQTVAVSEANYVAELSAESASRKVAIRARWVILSLNDQPQTVVLPVKNMVLEEATLDGQPAALLVDEQRNLSVQVAKKGIHLLDARGTVNLRGNTEAGEFELDLLPVGAGQLTLSLPSSEQRQLTLKGSKSAWRLTRTEEASQYDIPIDQGGKLQVQWSPEQQRVGGEQQVQCETHISVSASDLGLQSLQVFRLQPRGGTLSEQSFLLKGAGSVRSVTGPDVIGWELVPGEDKQIKVIFREPLTQESNVAIVIFQPANFDAPTPFALTMLVPQQVARETGRIGLWSADSLRMNVVDAKNLQQIPVEASWKAVTGEPFQIAYRFTNRPFDLSLEVTRRAVEIRSTAEHGIQVARRKMAIASRFELNLGTLPQRTIEFAIPAGYLPVDVTCPQATDWSVSQEPQPRLTIELQQPTTGSLEIGLEGHLPLTRETGELTMSVPSVLNVTRDAATVGIWFDDLYQASLTDAGRWRALRADELPPKTRQLIPQRAAQFAFETTEAPGPLKFQVQRLAPVLTVDSGILIAAGDATIDYGLTLRWTIAQAASDTFTFTTPDWLRNLEFDGPGIRQVRSEGAGPGRLRWIVTLLDPVHTQYVLTGAATVAIPSNQTIETPLIEVEAASAVGEPVPVEAQRQFAVLVNLSPYQLVPADRQQLEPMTSQEPPLAMPPKLMRQAMEIVRVRSGKLPAWKIQRISAAGGTQAVVTAAAMTTVLDLDGSWRTQAVYTVRNRGRQFLGLQLPEGSRLLSVFVRGQPSRTVTTQLGDRTVHLVALPQTSEADLSFDVSLFLAGQLSSRLQGGFSLRREEISLPAPQVLSPAESAEFGLTVAQTSWNVFVPPEVQAVPVETQGKTNLKWHSDPAAIEEQRLLSRGRSDLAELVRITSDEHSSDSVKQQAVENLKQLKSRLEQEQAPGDYYFSSNSSYLNFDSERSLNYQTENADLLKETEQALTQSRKSKSEPIAKQQMGRAFILDQNGIVGNLNRAQTQLDRPAGMKMNYFDSQGPRIGHEAGKAEESSSRALLRDQLNSQQLSSNQPLSGGGMGGGMGGGFIPQANTPQPSFGVGRSYTSDLNFPSRQGSFGTAVPPFASYDPPAPVAVKPPPAWTSTGGLSVAAALPISGNEFSFSKVGGQPQLTLSLRSRETLPLAASWLWCLAVLALGVISLRQVQRTGSLRSLLIGLLWVVTLGAAVFVFLLPWSALQVIAAIILFFAVLVIVLLRPQAAPVR